MPPEAKKSLDAASPKGQMIHAGFDGMRIVIAVIVGVIIALAIFLGLNKMLSGNPESGTAGAVAQLVNYVNTPRDIQVKRKELVKPPPPPPDKPPPPKQVQMHVAKNVPTQRLPVKVELSNLGMGGGSGLYINPNSGPAVNANGYAPLTPMVRFKPMYPPQAQIQGVTGNVNVCFTVEPDGTVSGPHVKHASSPQARRMLSQAALKTIRHWKFFPLKVSGKPVAAPACQVLQFKLGS